MSDSKGNESGAVRVLKGLEEFEEGVRSGTCVVDFWATWCKPCKDIAPKFNELAERFGDDVNFFKCDIADFEEDELVDMGLNKIPAFFVYKDGKKVEEFLGNECGDELEKFLMD